MLKSGEMVMITGFIKGMEDNGCKYVKFENSCLFFEIPERLSGNLANVKTLCNSQGIRLFTKVNPNLI